jgi:hypothetical protein
MKKSWDHIRERIEKINLASEKGRSHARHLVEIFDKSEEWEIDPANAAAAKISNLQEIVSEAQKAIRRGRKDRLIVLFQWAAECTNSELRILLREEKMPEITVYPEGDDRHPMYYMIRVTEDQYEKIIAATRRQFKYKIKREKADLMKQT